MGHCSLLGSYVPPGAGQAQGRVPTDDTRATRRRTGARPCPYGFLLCSRIGINPASNDATLWEEFHRFCNKSHLSHYPGVPAFET
jgi:hypothetical protein